MTKDENSMQYSFNMKVKYKHLIRSGAEQGGLRILGSNQLPALHRAVNARSIGNEEGLTELQYELDKMHWDVLGIVDMRRKEEECLKLISGHILFYKGSEVIGRVGIQINK